MSRRAWTDEELRLLRDRYGYSGPAALARLLNRSVGAVAARAFKEGLSYGRIERGVRISEVAEAAGVSVTAARKAAERAAEARRLGAANRPLIVVRHEWAQKYIQQAQERAQSVDLLEHHYDVNKVARIFNVKPGTVRDWLSGRGRHADDFANVRRHRAPGTHGTRWLLNPYDVERILKRRRNK